MTQESALQPDLHRVLTYKDIEYKRVNGRPLLLDLHVPAEVAGPVPLVFYVHGGGWSAGNKEDATNLDSFIAAGYAMSAMDYRFSEEAIFPAQIEDVKAAVRWLRAHAAEYNLDAERFLAWGHSAGGHLVSLLGLTADRGIFETGDNLQVSSRVQAVGSVSGPVDFIVAAEDNSFLKSATGLLGGHPFEQRELALAANPVTYITREAPPFLLVHGEDDDAVPRKHSELLHAALKKAGVPCQLVIQGGVKHDNYNHPDMVRELIGFFDRI